MSVDTAAPNTADAVWGAAGPPPKIRPPTIRGDRELGMADLEKTLKNAVVMLTDLRNTLDGIVDETIPQKLTKPWKSFVKVNEDVIDHADHILDYLKKNKGGDIDPAMQKDLDVLVRKWTAVNNVYGGLINVSRQCEEAMKTWEQVGKELKRL
jgi:hypothetical protein